jgi:hypothetical protein
MSKKLDYTFKISLESLQIIIDKIKDLYKLDNKVTFKFINDKLLLYSLVGDKKHIHAFKSHILNLNQVFLNFKEPITNEFQYVIEDSKRFVTSITVFIKYMINQNITEPLQFKLNCNEDDFSERLLLKNSKSKEETPGGRPLNNVNIDDIETAMNIEDSLFSFSLNKEDFDYIKAKTVIETNDNLYLNIKSNELSLSESRWEHHVCNIEHEDYDISFPKKYFKCINYETEKVMKIYVFETFLLILGDNTNLMIVTELSI